VSVVEKLNQKDPVLGLLLRLETKRETVSFFSAVDSKKELILLDGVEWLTSLPNFMNKTVLIVEPNTAKILAILEDPLFRIFIDSQNAYILTSRKLPVFIGGKDFDVFTKMATPLFYDIVEDVIRFEALYLEGKDLGLSHFQNALSSLKTFSSFYELDSVEGNFEAPWLIVGGAPLSEEDLDYIQKRKDTHWVIAAGAATKNLLQKGIRPDFATLVDPFPEEAKYIEHDIPTFFQLRAGTKFLQNCKGPLIWAGQNELYPFEGDLAQKAGLSDIVFDGGYDTVNFCALLAKRWGATQVVMKGVTSGRNTLNDLYSRLFLDRISLDKQQTKKRGGKLDKTYKMKSTCLNKEAFFLFLEQILSHEDHYDLDRCGLVDGYLRPLKLYLGNENIPLMPLMQLIEKTLEGTSYRGKKKREINKEASKSPVVLTTPV
jgi:hypothetical protein